MIFVGAKFPDLSPEGENPAHGSYIHRNLLRQGPSNTRDLYLYQNSNVHERGGPQTGDLLNKVVLCM